MKRNAHVHGPMELLVLGNAGEYLKPLAGGSGYLVDAGGARVLLDCGPGVTRALAEHGVEPHTLDAVVLSHFHFDHVLDFVPLLQALAQGTQLFLPPGTRGHFAALGHAFAFQGPFQAPGPVHDGRPGSLHTIKRARLDFAPTKHSTVSMATRIRAAGRSLVYASDTADCEGLRELAKKADLLLAHTLLPTVEEGADHAAIHLTARRAGEVAAASAARRLLLSHRYWENSDDEFLGEAGASFEAVELARTGERYQVP